MCYTGYGACNCQSSETIMMILWVIAILAMNNAVVSPFPLTTITSSPGAAGSRYRLSAMDDKNIDEPIDVNRRNCLSTFMLCLLETKSFASNAAMENSQTVFKAGEALGVEASKARFVEAQRSLGYLLDNYDDVVKGGGDNVRRYLGTVGTSSGMYGISKVLKELQEEAADIIIYTETMIEFDAALRAADTAVYSANFVEFSAAKTKPEKFFEDARTEAKRMQVYLNEMASELDIH